MSLVNTTLDIALQTIAREDAPEKKRKAVCAHDNITQYAQQLTISIPKFSANMSIVGPMTNLLQIIWKPNARGPTCKLLLGTSLIEPPVTLAKTPDTTMVPQELPSPTATVARPPTPLPIQTAVDIATYIGSFVQKLLDYKFCDGLSAVAYEATSKYELPLPNCRVLGENLAFAKLCPIFLDKTDGNQRCAVCKSEEGKLQKKIGTRIYADPSYRCGDRTEPSNIYNAPYMSPTSQNLLFGKVIAGIRQSKRDYANVLLDLEMDRKADPGMGSVVSKFVETALSVSVEQYEILIAMFAESEPEYFLTELNAWMGKQENTILKVPNVFYYYLVQLYYSM